MRADLHLHTVCSDGAYSPSEIAARCKAAGAELFSITDHDNMGGLREGAEAAKRLGLHFVRGIEVSAYLGATKVHILGYGCEEGEAYSRFLEERRSGALRRAEEIVRRADELFSLNVTMEDVGRYHTRGGTPLHTMHIVQAFADRLSADPAALYREAFAPGAPAYCDLCRPTPVGAVRTVHEMGGLAVIAHPAQILVLPPEISARFRMLPPAEQEEIKSAFSGARDGLMEELAAAGADGIECYHPTHTAEETERFLAFAKAHGLFVTGGSDFHADGGPRAVATPVFDACKIEGSLLSRKGSV